MRYLLLRLKRFCGFVTGIVFFIGGILKLMDPVGAGLVVAEYFRFLHIGFLLPLSKPAAILFALAETIVGTGLVTGVWRRIIGFTALGMQIFFTLLTLLLVIFNPEMDCGCFGEAIHLTHAQTFIKNIALLALMLAYIFPTKMLGHNMKHKYVSFAAVSASVVAFAVYSCLYIPLIDFTAYKPAAALKAGHAFATQDEDIYEAVFIYEKDGRQEEFTLGHLPDSTWTFVRTETSVKEGYAEDELLDLSFHNTEGEYADSLATGKHVMVISVYDVRLKGQTWRKIASFIENADKTGYTPLLLVAAVPDEADEVICRLNPETAASLSSCM